MISSCDETDLEEKQKQNELRSFSLLERGRIDRVGVSGPYPERIRVSENSHTVDLSVRSS